MTQESAEHLQTLWEDLEIFKFDLAWLELKKLLEKARKVKRLREDVECLVNEQKRRSLALAVTEMDLEAAKEEEGFTEIDMETELVDTDIELGYGGCSVMISTAECLTLSSGLAHREVDDIYSWQLIRPLQSIIFCQNGKQ
ncbi:hypothetical protein ACLB2K_068572 [Fragaria x ananassa]